MMRQQPSRRSFLMKTGAAFASLAQASHLTAISDASEADLIVLNARVYTVDPALPFANALAVKGGRFLAVGTNEEAKTFGGKRTQIIDARQ